MTDYRFPAALLGAAWVLALGTACSSPAPPEADGLRDAVVAVALSPQYADLANGLSDGLVVLFNASGESRSLRTAGMNTMQLAWTTAGLAFSDQTHDFVMDESIHRVRRTDRQLAQTALVPTAPQAFLGLFNVGFTSTGYGQAVTAFTPSTGSTVTFDGLVDVVAPCGDSALVVSHPVDAIAESTTHPYRLTRLTGSQGVAAATLVAEVDSRLLFSVGYNAAPCVGEEAFFIHAEEGNLAPDGTPPPSGSAGDVLRQAYLSRWSARTGQLVTEPLLDGDGRPLLVGADALFRAQYATSTLRDGNLSWVAGDGVLYRTTLSSLRTSRIGDGFPTGAPMASVYEFGVGEVHVLTPLGDPGRQIELVTYRLPDWTVVSRTPMPGLAGLQGPRMLVRDVAVRPGDRVH